MTIKMTEAEARFLGWLSDEGLPSLPKDGIGNDMLYQLCAKHPLGSSSKRYESYEILADQMWLIGRSYAASPERTHGISWCKDTECAAFNKAHMDVGYQSNLRDVANALCGDGAHGTPMWQKKTSCAANKRADVLPRRISPDDSRYDADVIDLRSRFESLKDCVAWLRAHPYSFDDSIIRMEDKEPKLVLPDECAASYGSDAQIIYKAVDSVIHFNQILRSARYLRAVANSVEDPHAAIIKEDAHFNKKFAFTYDRKTVDSTEQSSSISFCSKFLHFHAPGCVSIIDGIAKDKVRLLFNSKRPKVSTVEDILEGGILNILADRTLDLTDGKLKVDKSETEEGSYRAFCLREYYIAWLINRAVGQERANEYGRIMRNADFLVSNIQIHGNLVVLPAGA